MSIDEVREAVFDHMVRDFVRESNMIEGIKDVTEEEVAELHRFLRLDTITIPELERFVAACKPEKPPPLRREVGMNVRVGDHLPPPGGPHIEHELEIWLGRLREAHPWRVHQWYETHHPFMDGNGRSGRAVWAWQMVNRGIAPGLKLGFLHAFYYQTLHLSR